MTSSDIIGSLNEHLLRVLKELRSREQALAETQEALERYRRKFAVIIHQQVGGINSYMCVEVLYGQYILWLQGCNPRDGGCSYLSVHRRKVAHARLSPVWLVSTLNVT